MDKNAIFGYDNAALSGCGLHGYPLPSEMNARTAIYPICKRGIMLCFDETHLAKDYDWPGHDIYGHGLRALLLLC
jgi:hypothetical protein